MKVTAKQVEDVISLMPEGLSFKQACEANKVHYTAALRMMKASPDLSELYAHAREEYAHYRVQEMNDIAKNESIDVQRARLMIDVIKWESAKVLPKVYGDKVELGVDLNATVTHIERTVVWPKGQQGGN